MSSALRSFPFSTVTTVALFLCAAAGCDDKAPAPVGPWTAAETFFRTRPVYEQPLADGRKKPAGFPDIRAQTCGQCHQAQYAEWKTSIHAAAWTDPQFVEERRKGAKWLCVNCHTPLQVQHRQFPTGLIDGDVERPILVDNPDFDINLQQEGITCAGCHLRDGVIHSSDRADRGQFAPHPVKKDAAFLDGSSLCLRCHQATATYPGKTFVCTFNTGKEWQEGPYFERGKTCVDCHMPEKKRAIATVAPERVGRQHYWRGSGIPKFKDGPSPPVRANPPGLAVVASVKTQPKTSALLEVTTTNARAGHRLPSGDPERALHVEVTFLDGTGQALGPANVTTFRQHWKWHPVPEKLSDNRLAPEESRQHSLVIPPAAKRAVIEVVHERMSAEAAAYHHLTGKYPIAQITHKVEFELTPQATAKATVLDPPLPLVRPR